MAGFMIRVAALALALLLSSTSAMAELPIYRIEALDRAGPVHPVDARAINHRGDFTGIGGKPSYLAYSDFKGIVRSLEDSARTNILSINDHGDILGQRDGLTIVWWRGGAREELAIGGADINGAGQISGDAYFGPDAHAVLYDHGRVVDLGTLGGKSSYGSRINVSGDITGSADLPDGTSHGFVWRGGVMIDLGVLDADKYSLGNDINAAGHVCGSSTELSGYAGKPFFYDGAEMHALPMFSGRYRRWQPSTINRHDEIVGNGGREGAVYYWRGKLRYLKDLLDASGADWSELVAYGINDEGVIVGHGQYQSKSHAFVATPIEPAARALRYRP